MGSLQIIRSLTSVLHSFTGDLGIPPPMRLLRHSWSEDPDSLAAFSFAAVNTSQRDFMQLAEQLPSLQDPR